MPKGTERFKGSKKKPQLSLKEKRQKKKDKKFQATHHHVDDVGMTQESFEG